MLTLHELIPAMLTLIRVKNDENEIKQANLQIITKIVGLKPRPEVRLLDALLPRRKPPRPECVALYYIFCIVYAYMIA